MTHHNQTKELTTWFLSCHMSYGSRPRFSVKVSFGTGTCPIALDLTSWLQWAPVLSRAPRLFVGRKPQA
jgi:hypothetical protein